MVTGWGKPKCTSEGSAGQDKTRPAKQDAHAFHLKPRPKDAPRGDSGTVPQGSRMVRAKIQGAARWRAEVPPTSSLEEGAVTATRSGLAPRVLRLPLKMSDNSTGWQHLQCPDDCCLISLLGR